MHLVRFEHNGDIGYGYLDGDQVGRVTGDIFGAFVRGGPAVPLSAVRLLPPCVPSKIVAVTANFTDRLRELGLPEPELPPVYFKAPSAVIGPGDTIRLPPQSRQVVLGGELAVVIGRAARWVSADEAAECILGYTCANDVIAQDVAELDQVWTRASSFDTFCPLGPAIATRVPPEALMLRTTVNGATRQLSSTADMLFSVPQVVAFVTAAMTLLPGDVILMGTPAGVAPLADGDVVEVSLEHIGTLRNPVAA